MKSFLTIVCITLSAFYCKAQVWQMPNTMNNDTYGIQVRNDTVIVSGFGILSISYDNGSNWTSITAGLPANPFVRDVLWVNNRLFVTILYQGVWVSNNLGQTWQQFDGTTVPSNGPTEMGSDGTSLFIADVNGFLWKSALNTANLTKVLTVNGAVTDIAIDATGTIYASSVLNGVYKSTDHGATFTPMSNGLPQIGANLYSEVQTIASNGNGDIYCAVNNKGVFKYNTTSSTWEAKNNGIQEVANNIGTAYRGLLAFNSTVLLGTAEGNVYLSNNAGDSFTNISEGQLVPTYKIAVNSSRIFVTRTSVRYRSIGGLFGSSSSHEAVGQHEIKLFPNPAKDELTVRISDFTGQAEINLMDYSGRTVFSNQVESSSEFNLDVSSLGKGLYLLQAVADGAIIANQKFVKE